MKKFLIPITFALLIHPFIYGKTIYALSGSRADIQTAVDAASDGDTVVIPSGTYTCDGEVDIGNKSLHIKGAGRDSTHLNRTLQDGVNKNMFHVDLSTQKPVTFSDMTLHDTNGPYSVWNPDDYTMGIRIDGGAWPVKVYNMQFEGWGYAGLSLREPKYPGTWQKQKGVVWNCRFIDCYIPGIGYGVEIAGGGTVTGHAGAWNEGANLGGDYFVFVEDCYFHNCRHATTVSFAGKGVTRYCTFDYDTYDNPIDTHDYSPTQDARGARAFEIYKNNLTITSGSNECIAIHGGHGVIWNNAVTGGLHPPGQWILKLEPPEDKVPPEATYPVPDQVHDTYIWGNTQDGQSLLPTVYPAAGGTDIVQLDRDYFLYERPLYTPYPYPHPLRSRRSMRWPHSLDKKEAWIRCIESLLVLSVALLF